MPAAARSEVVRKGEPGIYHCTVKCVRGAFLLARKAKSRRKRNRRKRWATERLKLLVRCFTIDVAFKAIMSNHGHLVLRVLPEVAKKLTDREVVRRWLSVYPGYRIYDENWHVPTKEEIDKELADPKRVEELRKRLSDISWFMSAFSEYIARRANHEDGCKGAFWDGRFDCREVSGEEALLICGIYVDLNEIRAGIVDTPEASQFTSVGTRIAALRAQMALDRLPDENEQLESQLEQQRSVLQSIAKRADWLAPLTFREDGPDASEPSATGQRCSDRGLLPITIEQYIQLVDHFGRLARPDKRGSIPKELASILERLQVNPREMASLIDHVPSVFRRFMGTATSIQKRAHDVGRMWFHGIDAARRLFVQEKPLPTEE